MNKNQSPYCSHKAPHKLTLVLLPWFLSYCPPIADCSSHPGLGLSSCTPSMRRHRSPHLPFLLNGPSFPQGIQSPIPSLLQISTLGSLAWRGHFTKITNSVTIHFSHSQDPAKSRQLRNYTLGSEERREVSRFYRLNVCVKMNPQYDGISEKAMATHSSTLAWKILWTEEPGRLQFMGSWRVGHDWSDLAAAAAAWRYLEMGLPKATRSWGWSCHEWDWCLFTKRQERAFFQPLSPPYEDITKKSFLPRNQISQLFDPWTSQPAQLWEINFCCASHPFCGILLYQTKLTETAGNGKSVPRPAEGLSAMAHLAIVCSAGGEGDKCLLGPSELCFWTVPTWWSQAKVSCGE